MNEFEDAGAASIAETIIRMDQLGIDRQTTCAAIASATARALRAALGPVGAAEMLRAAADQIAGQFDS